MYWGDAQTLSRFEWMSRIRVFYVTAHKALLDTAFEPLLKTAPRIFCAAVRQLHERLSLTRIQQNRNTPSCHKTAAQMAPPHTHPHGINYSTLLQNSHKLLPLTHMLHGIKYSTGTLPQNSCTNGFPSHTSYMESNIPRCRKTLTHAFYRESNIPRCRKTAARIAPPYIRIRHRITLFHAAVKQPHEWLCTNGSPSHMHPQAVMPYKLSPSQTRICTAA